MVSRAPHASLCIPHHHAQRERKITARDAARRRASPKPSLRAHGDRRWAPAPHLVGDEVEMRSRRIFAQLCAAAAAAAMMMCPSVRGVRGRRVVRAWKAVESLAREAEVTPTSHKGEGDVRQKV